MITKLVYTVVSTENDIYLEQAVLSAHSVRKYSPDAKITLVVDERTNATIKGRRSLILKYIDDKVVVDLHEEPSNAIRSRILKTNLRNYINGPYLFVDTDTIICSPLYEIDNLIGKGINIAAVRDGHADFENMYFHDTMVKRASAIGWDLTNDIVHYNSGVMFVNDTPAAYAFYTRWHENWKYEKTKGFYFDQLALAHTNGEMGYPISMIDDVWNCQIEEDGAKYLDKAKIIHLFGGYHDDNVYYFKTKQPYLEIKEAGKLSSLSIEMLNHPRTAFIGHVTFVGNKHYDYYRSPMILLYKNYRKEFSMLESICSSYMLLRQKLNSLNQKLFKRQR